MNRLAVLSVVLVVFVGVARVEALVVDPGESALIVGLSDGSVRILGNDIELNAYQVESATGLLIPDPTANPAPFAYYFRNGEYQITGGTTPVASRLYFAAGSDAKPLTWTVDTTRRPDLFFQYGTIDGVFSRDVVYVTDPPPLP